jgi:hypothetical protein
MARADAFKLLSNTGGCMDAPGYVKVNEELNEEIRARHVRADPGLACWAALVHAWDGIDAALDDEAAAPDAGTAGRHAALTDLRPFG